MKIVILDGFALCRDELNFSALSEFGDVTFYERTPAGLAAKRIGDAEIVFTNKVNIDSSIMDKCKNLRWIGVLATGYNNIDVIAAKERDIIVTNIPGYSTQAVAQYVFSCILKYTNRISEHDKAVHDGRWITAPDYCFLDTPLIELRDKTIGIIGFGQIGRAVCKIALAFEMNVLVYSRTIYSEFESANVSFVPLDDLVSKSDFITIHCPLTPQTENMFNKEKFALMKRSAMLINSARGPIINEKDLADALDNDLIACAALDVLSAEPMRANNPLLYAKNCYITPHIAWAPLETRKRLLSIAIDNLRSYLNNQPKNVVNL